MEKILEKDLSTIFVNSSQFIIDLIEKKSITSIDYFLAERLLKTKNEEQILFLCYLSKAMREGHLCISLNPLTPDPLKLFRPDGGELSAKERNKILSLIKRGFKDIPCSLPVVKSGDRIYFLRYKKYEDSFLENFNRICQSVPEHIPEMDAVDSLVDSSLLTEQKKAILHSCKNALTLICGGPGTGKTYTAGLMLKVFVETYPGDVEVALAAPTGKAAANLQKSIKDANVKGDFKAKTLHSLLWRQESLNADFILIDESSMIDVKMMMKLLSAVKPGARLVLLGDPHQLPPVEAGAPFSDMTKLIQPIELKTCLRSDLKGILEFASSIKSGDLGALSLFGHTEGLLRVNVNGDTIKSTQQQILKYAEPFFSFDAFNRFRVLTPNRQGPFGVDQLNELFHQHFSNLLSVPIMIVSNDYRMELFNGETGVLLKEEDCALFPSIGGGYRKIPAILLPKYDYAYCLSVHKSQGSEFDHVLALVPPGSEVFGREVLYTAATRARKRLDVWGSDETLRDTIAKKSIRLSGID